VEQRICKSHRVLVGLEVHVQLSTQSKMFTGAANGFGGEPNTQVDEQVLGLPGVLPVMNKRAVEYAIKVGLALGCTIAKHTKWDRKSYYYPDLPKNYQISQYDLPLCYQGEFELVRRDGSTLKIRIRRAHLEEDAGKLLHEAPGGNLALGELLQRIARRPVGQGPVAAVEVLIQRARVDQVAVPDVGEDLPVVGLEA